MNKKLYLKYLVIIFVFAAVWVWLLARLAVVITEITDDHYYKAFKENDKGYIAPWYTNGLHVVDEGFISELDRLTSDKNNSGNIIAIGSSLTALEFDPVKQKERLRDSYDMYIFASGGGSWRTNIILDNLVRKEYQYTKKDIVKVEVSYSTFRNATTTTIAESTIDKWGKYRVTSEYGIEGNNPLLSPLYDLNVNLMRIQNVFELAVSYISPVDRAAKIGPGNYRNNYFNHENVAKAFSVTDDKIEKIETQLLQLDNETNVVVEFSPIAPGLAQTKSGKKYMKFIKKGMKPFLKKHGIKYLDYRGKYKEEDFIDGAHLSYDASIRYTLKLDHDLNEMIDKINGEENE
ncbi:hypothetical protein SAMN05216390_10345 [Lachnospiraceae bacterium KH1T2]|nr:hypothetical protein SAMN05216390_10345 [Lachnospiraceae bacterium KH1T2]